MNQKSYKQILIDSMQLLAGMEDSIFVGQQIIWRGNPMSTTLDYVPKEKMIELPVMEESQMGISLGLAMAGKFVITFYPRWDFIICAANQLINHVDKIQTMSNNQWNPNIIIRLGKGSDTPIDPGHQHKGNYFEEFKSICKNIKFYDCKNKIDLELAYLYSINSGGINCIIEYPELYNE